MTTSIHCFTSEETAVMCSASKIQHPMRDGHVRCSSWILETEAPRSLRIWLSPSAYLDYPHSTRAPSDRHSTIAWPPASALLHTSTSLGAPWIATSQTCSQEACLDAGIQESQPRGSAAHDEAGRSEFVCNNLCCSQATSSKIADGTLSTVMLSREASGTPCHTVHLQ